MWYHKGVALNIMHCLGLCDSCPGMNRCEHTGTFLIAFRLFPDKSPLVVCYSIYIYGLAESSTLHFVVG